MSLVYGSAATPAPSGTNTFLQWTGSAFAWSLVGVDASGNIASGVSSLTWPAAATSPALVQTAQGSDALPQGFAIQPQAPFASATGVNRAGGFVTLKMAAPTNSGTTEAKLELTRSGTRYGLLGASELNSAGLAIHGGNVTPSGSNYAMYADSTQTFINGPTSGGQVSFRVNGGQLAAFTSGGLGGPGLGVPMTWQQQTITGMVTTGTQALSTAQQQARLLIAPTTTLTGSLTIDFGGLVGEWILDLSAVTVGANTVTLKNGAGTKVVTTLISGTSSLLHVVCFTAATVNAL